MIRLVDRVPHLQVAPAVSRHQPVASGIQGCPDIQSLSHYRLSNPSTLKKASFALFVHQFHLTHLLQKTHLTANMKSFVTALLVAIFVALAMAATNSHVEYKPIIVSYPKGTPYSEMDELKAAIVKVVS